MQKSESTLTQSTVLALLSLGGILTLGCGESQLSGSIAGHALSQAETALFERVDEEGLIGIGIVLAEQAYTCDELQRILSGEGDPVEQDDLKEVAFVHFQILNLVEEGTLEEGEYEIQPDFSYLSQSSPLALAQVRLRRGSGYGVVAQLEAYDGAIDISSPSEADLAGHFEFQTTEGIVAGIFDAALCPDLGGGVLKSESP